MAKFRILTSFYITNRGLVIVGDIIEGEIQRGNWITFMYNDIEYKRKIIAIEMVDKIVEKVAHVGLILNHPTQKELKQFAQFKLAEQIVEIENY